MKKNINDTVRVELTDEGIKYMQYHNYYYKELINGNILETELWDLMSIFGKQMYMTAPQMFKNNEIEFM
jgi:hypothetical protein